MARPSYHHHYINEKTERANNGSEWWIFCEVNVNRKVHFNVQ